MPARVGFPAASLFVSFCAYVMSSSKVAGGLLGSSPASLNIFVL